MLFSLVVAPVVDQVVAAVVPVLASSAVQVVLYVVQAISTVTQVVAPVLLVVAAVLLVVATVVLAVAASGRRSFWHGRTAQVVAKAAPVVAPAVQGVVSSAAQVAAPVVDRVVAAVVPVLAPAVPVVSEAVHAVSDAAQVVAPVLPVVAAVLPVVAIVVPVVAPAVPVLSMAVDAVSAVAQVHHDSSSSTPITTPSDQSTTTPLPAEALTLMDPEGFDFGIRSSDVNSDDEHDSPSMSPLVGESVAEAEGASNAVTELEKHIPDAHVLITTPFHPAYVTEERIKRAKKKTLDLESSLTAQAVITYTTECQSSKVMFEHTMNFNTFTIRSFVLQFHNSDEVAREMVLSLHISTEASYSDLSSLGAEKDNLDIVQHDWALPKFEQRAEEVLRKSIAEH
ncbi:hypothetical protein Vadar_009356 [Vaccinium darrowii]|uniref:Uncharacterized protein n=1 Tax=Vaccinium darrowii TaxID=229202 RepID=A0ACB7XHH5_9ERIC|nr:hypothetical protein Vadar_009356 [Vaccinium darrowii]